LIGGRIVPRNVETDLQHGLADPIGQHPQVDIGPDVATPPRCPQGLVHRLQNRRRAALRPFDEFGVGARSFIQRDLYGGAMRDRATCDRAAQIGDSAEAGPRVGVGVGVVEGVQGALGDAVQVGVIAPQQLGE
jgi:hypothetical protein